MLGALGAGAFIAQLPMGAFVSRVGERIVILAAHVLIGASVAALGVVSVTIALVSLRAVAGVGSTAWLLSRHSFPTSTGHRIWRYRLAALDEMAQTDSDVLSGGSATPGRSLTTVQRIVRSTQVSNVVKALHEHRCQACGQSVTVPSGEYAEAAHFRPLGRPHDGPDVPGNVLCLCPNDHVRFDRGAIWIDEDLNVVDAASGTAVRQLRAAKPRARSRTTCLPPRHVGSRRVMIRYRSVKGSACCYRVVGRNRAF